MPQLEQLTYAVEDRIATITLNRPDTLNAFTSRMVHEMVACLDETDADDDVRAVIITGAGRGFCAGADMSSGEDTFEKTSGPYDPASRSDQRREQEASGVRPNPASGERSSRSDHAIEQEASGVRPDNKRARDGGGIVSLRMFNSLKPLIAAVNGPAAGVGATMLLPMDVRIASTTSKFGFVFTQRGIVPEACSSWFLPRVVGISQALEWCYRGDVFGPEEALAGGLIKSIHEPDDLMAAARTIATQIAESTSSISISMTRQLLWRMLGAAHPMEAHQVESAAVPQLGSMADAKEGVTSFFEKRPAEFTLGPSKDMPAVFPWFTDPEFEAYE